MKQYFVTLGIACVIFFIIPGVEVSARFGKHLTIAGNAKGHPPAPDFAPRIERIENGLLPAATIKGQPMVRMNLAERMKHYNVPGVSIAFFENGQIAGTRSYGIS